MLRHPSKIQVDLVFQMIYSVLCFRSICVHILARNLMAALFVAFVLQECIL